MAELPLMKRAKERQDILKGLYEENLSIEKPVAPRKRVPHAEGGRRIPYYAMMLGVLLLVAAFAFSDLAGSDPGPDVIRQASISIGPEGGGFLTSEAQVHEDASASDPADLSLANLYGLEVRTIVIDAGHGGMDSGALGQLGTQEKDITLDVALRLKRRLEQNPGYHILLTRGEDVRVPNRERVKCANEHDADLFISIHLNWLPVEPLTAVETYYFGAQAEGRTMRLAERENTDSGYSLAEFREMVQRIGNTMKLEESKRLAESIQRSLYQNVQQINPEVTDWGVKTAPFVVLLGVESPSVLVEITCISNKEEEIRLNTVEYREQLTSFLEEGIINYLNKRPSGDEITKGATENVSEEDKNS